MEKRKKIIEIKYTGNISFPETRKIEQTQEHPSYVYVTRKEMRKTKIQNKGGARGVMVIVVGNGYGDASSNPGQD